MVDNSSAERRGSLVVMISSPLEPELVDLIRATPVVSEVLYDPILLPPARYPNDHGGDPTFRRTEAQELRWREMLSRADALIGYPQESAGELARVLEQAPRVRFVQGTSAGMGAHIRRAELSREVLERVNFASAAGVHAGMLAEFVFYGLLWLRKDAARLAEIRAAQAWTHYAMGELQGSTVAVVGMGHIGRAVASRARAFGMEVLAVTRTAAPEPLADSVFPTTELTQAFRRTDAVVLTLPLTPLTTGLISTKVLGALRPTAVLCNVGRGAVIDQPALLELLQVGRLAGAVLDVFAEEPLPPGHPLWTMENVVLSPHTAALSVHESRRIVELFCKNLSRLAADEPLLSAVNLREFY
ncbi:MAG TPA: D-2-hydroxyacid dehydrogenase [Candidatus Dormibacteraeota bacterium]|nr:D-2-hydroxyacid dehydrogenase [Candidatus Dormibacteraeota bacterium]